MGGVERNALVRKRTVVGNLIDEVAGTEHLGQIAVCDGLLLQLYHEVRAAALGPVGHILPLGGAVLLQIHIGETETHRHGLAQAEEVRGAGLCGHARRESKVGVAGAVDEHPAGDLDPAGLAVDDRGNDAPVAHLAVGHMRPVKDTAAGGEHHLLHHELAGFGIDGRQMRLHAGVAGLVHAVDEFLGIAIHITGHAGDITVGVESAQRLAHLQQDGALPVASSRQRGGKSGRAAAADDDVRVDSSACEQHKFSLPIFDATSITV